MSEPLAKSRNSDSSESVSARVGYLRDSSKLDPLTLMRIKNLELRAKVVAEGFMAGLHRSPYHGFSVEFTDYRAYSPGDDPRFLDWKLYGRVDRFFIKRFEDETNLRCNLVVDLSRSMSFGSSGFSKADYARTLAATLAYFLSLQRDAVGLLTFDQSIGEYIPPRYRPGHLRRVLVALERAESGNATDVSSALEQIAMTVTKRGMVVLVSDFLTPVETLEKQLGYLRSRGHDVVVFRVLDRAEVDFNFDQESLFQDEETGKQIYVNPETVRDDYLQRFNEHAQQLESACSKQGIEFFNAVTDEPMDQVLLNFLGGRASTKSGKAVKSNTTGKQRR